MQLSDYFFVPALSLAIDRNRTNTFTTKAQRNRVRAEKTPEKKNRGVGLVEVLISLLVITIGILGMAGVHSSSLQYNQSSYVQSQATFLATDMLDRIQANNSLARSGTNYQVGLNDLEYSQCIEIGYPNNCETGSCSPQEMAAYDILQWKFQLTCQLPGSKGSITYLDSNGVRTYIIRLSFPDMGNRVPLSDVVLRGIL